MEQLRNFGDERQLAFCAYCGSGTETRDHVPSKVFLDEPYPANLPVVPACQSCNEGFSLDEEYVACLAECAVTGSVNADNVRRDKVRSILLRTPSLSSRLRQAGEVGEGTSLRIEPERVRNVVLKLARGHAAFELNEPQLDEPSHVAFVLLFSMTQEVREDFETPPRSSILPEVGSRATQRLVVSEPGASVSSLWLIVQRGRYRYLTSVAGGVIVRVVIGEYLGCEVVWRDR